MKKYLVPALLSIAFVILLMSLSSTIPTQKQPQPQPTTPTLTAIVSTKAVEIPWQTYRNEKHGFEFQYPSILSVSSFPNKNTILSLITPDSYGNALEIYIQESKSTDKDIFSYFQNLSKKCKRGDINGYTSEDVCDMAPNVYNLNGEFLPNTYTQNINQIDFIIKQQIGSDGVCGPYSSASWKNGKTILTMYFSDCLYDINNQNLDVIFPKILSTFKFTQ